MTAAAAQQITTDNSAENYNPIKGTRFFPIPAAIASRPDLTTNAKMVYGYLCSCYGRDGLVCPKISTISNQCGLSPRSAGRAVTELKQAGLIAVMRTGRASYYRFISPDQAEPVNRSANPSLSDTPNLADQKPVTPYIENKSLKKQTTRRVVVSLGNESDVKACLDAIPQQHKTPSTEKIVRISLTSHSVDAVLLAIQYANAKATKNYGAYLNLTLKNQWALDFIPPEAEIKRSQADIAKDILTHEMEVKEAEQRMSDRETLAYKWLQLTITDKDEIRNEYLKSCNKFQAKRARRLSDELLAQNIGFRLFLEGEFK